ncbi:MAG: holo-[acyl-carrier-protein] synthase [Dictyoglomus sp. NZ13-RE01]|nr:MAG: holo-[acyl-carrier-protein] synthase [Dictyoglomus sp. NZ13-RE01]
MEENLKILGLGLDIIEIDRIREACIKHKNFIERIYSLEERRQVLGRKDIYPSLAVRFSAKEAFIKALGGKYEGWCWRDVEILTGINGKPEVRLKNKALEEALKRGIKDIKLSLSHSNKYAVAVMIILG